MLGLAPPPALGFTEQMRVRLVAAFLGLGVCTAMTGCTGDSDQPSTSSGCHATVDQGSLPVWARGGFTPADQAIPHVVGAKGSIAGVLFGYPLSSPEDAGRSNKILWVSKPEVEPGSTLKIHATLDGTSTVADRQVDGGPGPSNIDLPKPGCWTVNLSWSGQNDTVQLEYVKG